MGALARTSEETVGASAPTVSSLRVRAFEIPVDGPGGVETDGTLEWDSTTIVVVELEAGGEKGLGYTYSHAATAKLIDDKLRSEVEGASPLDTARVWQRMTASIRNAGRPGIGMMAVSAVDTALWDLKARLLGVSLRDLFGAAKDDVPVYGSGGFCNYPLERLQHQLSQWVQRGIPRVKIKVARRPEDDPKRLAAAREAVGDGVDLFVDANGAYDRKQALYWASRFADEWRVRWLEEPLSSADFEGLKMLRDRAPGNLDVAAGEYVFVLRDAVNLLQGGCVDCLQLDVTRCGGYTGFLAAAGAAKAYSLDVSGHCAPQLTAPVGCALERFRHLEHFHDHVRIEDMLFEGVLEADGGRLKPDPSRPGHGLSLREDLPRDCLVYDSESG